MSKSKGEFLTVSLLEEKGYNPLVYRMFCLQSHYRKPLEFSYEVLDNVTAAYNKLTRRIANLKDEGELDKDKMAQLRSSFEDALCSDLNTSSALTVVYDVLKADMSDKSKLELLKSFDEVLSLGLVNEAVDDGIDHELEKFVLEKIEQRKSAKKEKNYAKADEIRNELLARGIVIKDTKDGVVWEKA